MSPITLKYDIKFPVKSNTFSYFCVYYQVEGLLIYLTMKIFEKVFVEYTEKCGSFTRREAIECVAEELLKIPNLCFSPTVKLNELIEHVVRVTVMVRNSHKFCEALIVSKWGDLRLNRVMKL
jgi:hypothetical protein